MTVDRNCFMARDRNKRAIWRGSIVLYLGHKSGEHFVIDPTPVKVLDIRRQGADGTILVCDAAPKPEYPNYKSCRASNTIVVSDPSGNSLTQPNARHTVSA